jgi:hypothetical protein
MTNPFKAAPRQIYSDEELDSLSKNDMYRRKKWIADTLAWVFVGLIVAFGLFFLWWLLTDTVFRDDVKKVVVNNLVGIVISGFVVIGFSVDRKR